MGSGEASPCNALSLNEGLGEVPVTDALHLGSLYAGKDLGELEHGAGLPVTCFMWHDLDSFVAAAT